LCDHLNNINIFYNNELIFIKIKLYLFTNAIFTETNRNIISFSQIIAHTVCFPVYDAIVFKMLRGSVFELEANYAEDDKLSILINTSGVYNHSVGFC
jgi:hypothetical protein